MFENHCFTLNQTYNGLVSLFLKEWTLFWCEAFFNINKSPNCARNRGSGNCVFPEIQYPLKVQSIKKIEWALIRGVKVLSDLLRALHSADFQFFVSNTSRVRGFCRIRLMDQGALWDFRNFVISDMKFHLTDLSGGAGKKKTKFGVLWEATKQRAISNSMDANRKKHWFWLLFQDKQQNKSPGGFDFCVWNVKGFCPGSVCKRQD